jgi:HAD superfamily hydrolase (TIGR01509 family)
MFSARVEILDNLSLRPYFPVIIGANDVGSSKLHPEVFRKAASALGVYPENCIMFEDVRKELKPRTGQV